MEIPKELEKDFIVVDENFEVSKLEEYMLQDIYMSDEEAKLKLNRDVTKEVMNEINMYKKQKRNIRFVLKGETRSGKSLVALRIGDIIMRGSETQEFNKDVDNYVCGNQNEYKKKLQKAEFGDFYLVDENFFSQAGLGTNIDKSQLQDYNNVIAKKNISVLFITPEKFLNVGATLGLSSYARDPKNWLSKFLVYKFKDSFPYLIGYIKIDIGAMFREHGCFIYKEVGGCNNTNQKLSKEIPQRFVKHSSCIPKDFDKSQLREDKQVCPFFDICTHGLCNYEKKKDTWIEKEMKGGLDMRTAERYTLALKLILMFEPELEGDQIKLRSANNQKDLKSQIDILLPTLTNTKFGIAEQDLILKSIMSNTKLPVLANTLVLLENEALKEKYANQFGDVDFEQVIENANNIINEFKDI